MRVPVNEMDWERLDCEMRENGSWSRQLSNIGQCRSIAYHLQPRKGSKLNSLKCIQLGFNFVGWQDHKSAAEIVPSQTLNYDLTILVSE
jgi:hypothetical protein